MMNKTILMLSASCMSLIAGADWCCADFNHFDTSPSFIPAGVKSHVSTHTSHLTAAHLSSLEDFAELTLPENSGNYLFYPLPKDLGRGWGGFHNTPLTQLAAACFVTDTTNCSGNEFANADSDDNDGGIPPGGDDYDLDNAERCRQEGYNQTSCPEGQDPVNTCPYDSDYFEECVSSCPSNYVTCEVPYYGVGEDCDGKYASCEKDTERACKEENPNYTNSCDYGFKLSDDRCSYDSSYGTCCNACTGYPYTPNGIPDGYIQDGEPCFSCDGLTLVKAKPNPCDGYMDCGSMGPETGAKSCQSGNQIKYDNCKACPNLGSLTYCPAPFTCSYEDCSGLYYKTGCQPGYDWNESTKTCTKQCAYECTLTSCPSPFTCRYEDCSGKYCKTGCQSGYDWNESTKTCTKQCAYECTLTSCPSPFTCRYEDCSGKYCKTGCQSGYDWNSSSQTCTKQCSADYQYTCTGTGYAGGSGTSCNGKYKSCNCASGYEWKDGICKEDPKAEWGKCNGYAKNCNIGDILYSDGTCASTVISGKTPVAVVVYKSDDGNCAQAMTPKPLTNSDIPWSTEYVDTGAYNTWIISNVVKDFDSCGNTEKIISFGDENTYPAAWKAVYYAPLSAPETLGKWCLPAAGVLSSLFYNLDIVNNTLSKIEGTQFKNTGNSEDNEYLWSSTETDETGAWVFSNTNQTGILNGGVINFGKTYGWEEGTGVVGLLTVRPVIEF